MSKLIESKIECPFYVRESERAITCEGCIAGTVAVQRFNDRVGKSTYENNVCSVFGGRRCPHYRAVAVQYDRGQRGD